MGTVAVNPENMRILNELRAPAETFLGNNPGRESRKINSKAEAWTMTRYRALSRQISQLKADEPVTLLNMNCFPLKINGGVYFPEEIPACPLGQPYIAHVIRQTRWGHKDLGCDMQNMLQMEPVPAVPFALASEYIRFYMQVDGRFGGVICYAGDKDPATIKSGELVRVPTIGTDELGELDVIPVERDFWRTMESARIRRNQMLMHNLQLATSWYESDTQRHYVNDTHRDMARLAFQEGLIPELPRWVLVANTLMEKQPDPCPSCQAIPKAGAIMCANCAYVIDVVETYRLRPSACPYGSVEMERCTAAEMAEIHKIKAERDKVKGKHSEK